MKKIKMIAVMPAAGAALFALVVLAGCAQPKYPDTGCDYGKHEQTCWLIDNKGYSLTNEANVTRRSAAAWEKLFESVTFDVLADIGKNDGRRYALKAKNTRHLEVVAKNTIATEYKHVPPKDKRTAYLDGVEAQSHCKTLATMGQLNEPFETCVQRKRRALQTKPLASGEEIRHQFVISNHSGGIRFIHIRQTKRFSESEKATYAVEMREEIVVETKGEGPQTVTRLVAKPSVLENAQNETPAPFTLDLWNRVMRYAR